MQPATRAPSSVWTVELDAPAHILTAYGPESATASSTGRPTP